MTRLQGRPPGLPEPERASPNGDHSATYHSKLPADAPELLARHTVYVTDPSRILACSKEDRQRNFNLLVKRYKNQLLYGCKDPNCTTATCFTCRKRVADAPLRRFTDLSARTVACYLASQDNPERGLCHNEPVTNIDGLAHDDAGHSRSSSRRDTGRTTARPHRHRKDVKEGQQGSPVTSRVRIREPQDNVRDTSDRASGGSEGSATVLERGGSMSPATNDSKRPKDPKSFTQNLFDTLALRMVEWLPLKRPSEGYGAKASEDDEPTPGLKSSRAGRSRTSHDAHRNKRSGSLGANEYQETPKSKPSNVSSTPTSTAATSVELKLPGPSMKRLSLGELENWRPPLRTVSEEKPKVDRKPVAKVATNRTPSTTAPGEPLSPPSLGHRPQKHKKGQKNQRGDIDRPYRSRRDPNRRRVSWDGRQETRQDNPHMDEEHPISPTETIRRPFVPRTSMDHGAPDLSRGQARSRSVQSLSCLSKDVLDSLEGLMFGTVEEWEEWKAEMQELESRGYSELQINHGTARQRQLYSFITQSVFYVLSSPPQLLESFRLGPPGEVPGEEVTTGISVDTAHLEESFRKLCYLCPLDTTFHSLWLALEKFFVLPKEFGASGSAHNQRRPAHCSTPSDSGSAPRSPFRDVSTPGDEYISDSDAAHIIIIVLFALTSSIPQVDSHAWETIRRLRSAGTVLPDYEIRKRSESTARLLVDVADKFEHDLALRLVNRLARVVAGRLAFHEMSKTRASAIQDIAAPNKQSHVVDLIIRSMENCIPISVKTFSTPFESSFLERPTTMPMIAVEWLRTLLLKEWDGNPTLAKSSAAGGALQLLSSMYRERAKLALQPEDFHTPYLYERLDPMDMPVEWLGMLPDNRTTHLLSYPFMFPPSALLIYFRALNYTTMSRSYENAMTASRHVTQTAFSSSIPIQDDVSLLARLKTSISTYLVLIIRRDNVLADALNQLWRRERRELLRPLKVQMGMDEGEEGVDHGGVQQEFFRVAMAEAIDPAFGMFTIENRSGMAWFQPCSLEPLYKYELLGLLMSLAMYNGLTVPVNFPVALYRKLLGLKVKKVEHISVGWPDLAKGLRDLLTWDDGDVGDIFVRTYEFSFDAFGEVVAVDMERTSRSDPWPAPERIISWDGTKRRLSDMSMSKGKDRETDSRDDVSTPKKNLDEYQPPSRREVHPYGILKSSASRQRTSTVHFPQQEASLVTNANREQFVKDYIFWLTDKSVRPQYEAFAQGFYSCLDQNSLSLFTPESLKTVIEGIQEIDISELQRHARYEGGYGPNHRVIRDFWHVAKRFSQEKRSQLLEFVTACDRVPVSGISSIMFVIQKNGTGDSRLPTSLTCFGRLLLPEYSSQRALEEKLNIALENAKGFGTA